MKEQAAAEGATPGTAQAKGLRESTKTLESDGKGAIHRRGTLKQFHDCTAISQVQGTEG